MGRKLRFFVTKNHERKKALAAWELTLPVSIPLCLGVAVHQLSVEVDVENTSELTVMLPISSYVDVPCQDLAQLQSRLKASNRLPSGWIDGSNGGTPLVFCYILCELPTFSAKIFYTFRMENDFTWMLSVCGTTLPVEPCTLLTSQPGKLSTLSSIVGVLEVISSARVCVGNPDKRYAVLVEARNGSFLDSSGKLITVICYKSILASEKANMFIHNSQ